MKVFDGLHAFVWRQYSENNCNTYLIDAALKILIDPGHFHLFDHVRKNLSAVGLTPDKIDVVVATHGHPDHMEAVQAFGDSTMFAMGEVEHRFITELAGKYFKIPEPNFFLKEGDLNLGNEKFEVIKTPGHSPGSICLYWPAKKALFSGDVVFDQSIGRSDLPGGNGAMLKESIQLLSGMDVDYILSGHGEIVVGKKEVKANFERIKNYFFDYL